MADIQHLPRYSCSSRRCAEAAMPKSSMSAGGRYIHGKSWEHVQFVQKQLFLKSGHVSSVWFLNISYVQNLFKQLVLSWSAKSEYTWNDLISRADCAKPQAPAGTPNTARAVVLLLRLPKALSTMHRASTTLTHILIKRHHVISRPYLWYLWYP